jgi:threonine synthase
MVIIYFLLRLSFLPPAAGGYMAKLMGVPIGMLCAGVNANDITHRAFQTGKFHKSSDMKKTLSDAINVQIVR